MQPHWWSAPLGPLGLSASTPKRSSSSCPGSAARHRNPPLGVRKRQQCPKALHSVSWGPRSNPQCRPNRAYRWGRPLEVFCLSWSAGQGLRQGGPRWDSGAVDGSFPPSERSPACRKATHSSHQGFAGSPGCAFPRTARQQAGSTMFETPRGDRRSRAFASSGYGRLEEPTASATHSLGELWATAALRPSGAWHGWSQSAIEPQLTPERRQSSIKVSRASCCQVFQKSACGTW